MTEMIDNFQFKENYDINDLVDIVEILRSPDGCPWDREQDHKSIRRDFLEETYEVIEAINKDDRDGLLEELGDVLLQVVFHTQIEREKGSFELSDVADGIFPASCLGHIHQVTLVVHMDHRLDLQQGACYGGGCADPAAPLQVHQVIGNDPVAKIQLVFLHPGGQFLQRQARIPLLTGIPDQKALTQRSAEGVHHIDLPIRVAFLQFLGSDDSGLIGGAEAGGEHHHQRVITCLQHRLNSTLPTLGVDGGGGSGLAVAHTLKQVFQPLLGVFGICLALVQYGQGADYQVQLLVHICRQVAAGIGNDLIAHRKLLKFNAGHSVAQLL